MAAGCVSVDYNKMLRLLISILFCLEFVISASSAFGLSESDEYFPFQNEGSFENYAEIKLVSLVKRETENISNKKATYSEKKVKLKSGLSSSADISNVSNKTKSVDPLNINDSTTTTTSSTITTTTNNSISSNSAWPELPYDLPTNFTAEDDTNNTHHYIYYNATFHKNLDEKDLWINLDNLTIPETVITHQMLSNSHRRAATIPLSFDFPFYGHLIRNITIATGGFLYTGDYMHTWLAATQYIAPLMANFDTSAHNESIIKYVDTGSAFTVQWENVYLQDKIHDPFSFQVTLFKTGDISFIYKKVPLPIKLINDESHPVKVGLSDAYIMEKTVVFIRRKTIYEYHRADLSQYVITNDTAIYFTALPTCQNHTDCQSCLSAETSFECNWCQAVDRCSSGLDRHRQDWLSKDCDTIKRSENKCDAPQPVTVPTKPATSDESIDKNPFPPTVSIPKISTITPSTLASNVTSGAIAVTSSSMTEMTVTDYFVASLPSKVVTLPTGSGSIAADSAARVSTGEEQSDSKASVGAGAVVAILMIVCFVTGFGMWMIYAYKFPQSPSGQLLIRYRPSQWRWRHGEARYTAASIHI